MQPPLLSFSAISTFGPTRPPSSVDADVLNGCPLRAADRLQQPLIENKLRSLERVGNGPNGFVDGDGGVWDDCTGPGSRPLRFIPRTTDAAVRSSSHPPFHVMTVTKLRCPKIASRISFLTYTPRSANGDMGNCRHSLLIFVTSRPIRDTLNDAVILPTCITESALIQLLISLQVRTKNSSALR